jgi:alkanesulfonate monooxygenase SsuD/methylene tetrahydromethanopterin reductase-like flavin-dependent oxidoreductase (luciferase family)
VLATAHVPVFEPLVAAKQGATIDHIGGGRFGLNVVAGWSDSEMAMFGKKNPEHDERYAIADEWITLVKNFWTSGEEFDYDGRYYQAHNAYLAPLPLQDPRPVIVQAGSSPAGMDFAARHADFGFQVFPEIPRLTEMNADLKDRARAHGREIGVLSTAYVVCADTEKEARRIVEWYVDEHGDFDAAGNLIEQLIGGASQSWPEDAYRGMARGVIAGWSGFPLVGTPEQITDLLLQLKHAGTDGVGLSWLDYRDGLDRFNAQVLPLMVDAGLRSR